MAFATSFSSSTPSRSFMNTIIPLQNVQFYCFFPLSKFVKLSIHCVGIPLSTLLTGKLLIRQDSIVLNYIPIPFHFTNRVFCSHSSCSTSTPLAFRYFSPSCDLYSCLYTTPLIPAVTSLIAHERQGA